jgi:16S rRNA (uracil1498-N3)-methyltransferase
MHRFFIKSEDVSTRSGVLRDQEAHHLSRVLRLTVGASVSLFDGSGAVYEAVVEEISKTEVQVRIVSTSRDEGVSRFTLHVGLPFLKGKKMDFVVQKATELGVATIAPFLSTFCVAGSEDSARQKRRLQRWEKISLQACKQCGRPGPPRYRAVSTFATLVREMSREYDSALKLIFWEKEQVQGLKIVEEWVAAGNSGPVCLLVGPEGGFSDSEVAAAVEAGFGPVTLGDRVLRAETALLTAMGVVQYLLGNLNR